MNRRQRRSGAAAKSKTTSSLTSAAEIPMSLPQKSPPKGKTLYEIASERQAQLAAHHGQPFPNSTDPPRDSKVVKLSRYGSTLTKASVSGEDGDQQDAADTEELNPIFDTLFLALPMSVLHFTLSVLAVHQYAQELRFGPIIINSIFVAFPTLTLVIHLLHGHLIPVPLNHSSQRLRKAAAIAQQTVFLITANVAGCYLIHVTNDKGYYAVMKKAPSIGTVWVWSVLELGLLEALLGVAGPGLFAWWNGYGF